MIWVYAICDRPDLPAPPRRGLADAPLDAVREGALMAVITRHEQSVGSPGPDALWAHERVVERLMADRTVLPMRFGSTLADEDELRRLLADRQASFLATLARVAGRVELGVRVARLGPNGDGRAPAVEEPEVPPTGRDYVLGKLRDAREADRAGAPLHEPLAALAAGARRHTPRSADEVLRGAYLVDHAVVPRFRGEVERLRHAHPGLAILCTGPWPAYSFVGDTAREQPVVG